jgi:hypothetical protein
VVLTFILKLPIVHALLNSDWDLNTNILNTFYFIFSFCIANFVSSCPKITKVPSKSYFFLYSKWANIDARSRIVCWSHLGLVKKKCTWKKLDPKTVIQELVFFGKQFLGSFVFEAHFVCNISSDVKSANVKNIRCFTLRRDLLWFFDTKIRFPQDRVWKKHLV